MKKMVCRDCAKKHNVFLKWCKSVLCSIGEACQICGQEGNLSEVEIKEGNK